MPTDRPARGRSITDTDLLILAGGLGSRLQSVISDRPKGLAPIQGRPFLDILVDEARDEGIRRIIFCVGYYKEQIIARYEGRADAEYDFSSEDEPLGTGGAVQKAMRLVRSDPVLIMNGDSLCRVDLGAFFNFHQQQRAVMSMVLTKPAGETDGGLVRINEAQRIEAFTEKAQPSDGDDYVNAGIYLSSAEMLRGAHKLPPFSLEYDFFPDLVKANPCFGFVADSPLVDIGTPERFRRANAEPTPLPNPPTASGPRGR